MKHRRFHLLNTLLTALLCAMSWCTVLSAAENAPSAPPNPKVCAGVNDFGFRLLRTLSDGSKRENVIVSPLSLSLALAMAYEGAAGGTRTAIAHTIGAPSLSDGEFSRANLDLIRTFRSADPKVEMSIANAMWIQSGFSIEPAFRNVVKESYEASAQVLDFAGNPEGAANTINSWVKKETRGRIPTIISAPVRDTRLVLTDAIYFKGRWTRPFDKAATKSRDFFPPKAAAVKAPMMSQSGEYSYMETDTFQAIRLPYGNGRLAMYVFLPRDKAGMPAFLGRLSEPDWAEWIGKFGNRRGTIALPKLEAAWGRRMNDPLKAMGMEEAFEPGKADFSRIHAGEPSLYIDDVEHKTWVKVDEEGTEAAAASSVGMAATMAQISPPPFQMIVDHPYLFAITEQHSGTLLFAAVVADPTQSH